MLVCSNKTILQLLLFAQVFLCTITFKLSLLISLDKNLKEILIESLTTIIIVIPICNYYSTRIINSS